MDLYISNLVRYHTLFHFLYRATVYSIRDISLKRCRRNIVISVIIFSREINTVKSDAGTIERRSSSVVEEI